MHTSGECMDGAGDCVGGVMANDATVGTVLLVGDAHGGLGSCRERGEVFSVGNDGMVGCVESHITYFELLSASVVLAVMTGVFTTVQQVVKCNGTHVADSMDFGGQGGGTLLDEEFDQANGDGKLMLCWWVLVSKTFKLSFKLQPVTSFSTV